MCMIQQVCVQCIDDTDCGDTMDLCKDNVCSSRMLDVDLSENAVCSWATA